MKVCTDSLIFGAYIDIPSTGKILDVGAGTGLLSLMAAQRGADHVTAVECCHDAYKEAMSNVAASPWPEKVAVIEGKIQQYANKIRSQFDCIICNPPFFNDHLGSEDKKRHRARHNDELSLSHLLDAIDRLLVQQGTAYVLLPYHAKAEVDALLFDSSLLLAEVTYIRSFERSPIRLMILKMVKQAQTCRQESLFIYHEDRSYSLKATQLLKSFLLRFQ